jgi:hypothetical protein
VGFANTTNPEIDKDKNTSMVTNALQSMFRLLLCLFAGGALGLRHGDSATTLNWQQALHAPYGYGYYTAPGGQTPEQRALAHVPNNAGLQWGAFFGDVEHEVQQVRPLPHVERCTSMFERYTCVD